MEGEVIGVDMKSESESEEERRGKRRGGQKEVRM